MRLSESLAGPLASIIDRIVPDEEARQRAKIELIKLEGSQELEALKAQLSAIAAEAASTDPWIRRARPGFLYVIYLMLLWALPMGVLAAFRPEAARDIATGMNAYLNGLPEPLYALFGTGYLGYTVARQWGKVKGVER